MSDLTIKCFKMQGKKAKAIYPYKATMNDEISFKIDDLIVITQSSEDDTWLEGTLNGRTGWFPSNYVQIIEDEQQANSQTSSNQFINESVIGVAGSTEISNEQIMQTDEVLRIKNINELRRTEEGFLDELCKFVQTTILPLQQNTGTEIFPLNFMQQMNSSLDELIRCHQAFYQHFKEIPDNADAKIGHLLITMAPQYKLVYDSYAKNNPKFTNLINKKKDLLSKFFESSKINSPMIQSTTSATSSSATTSTSSASVGAAIHITKYLAMPFKQLEIYVKILREIHRYTEDYHVDRGDVQRSIEFYTDLSTSVQEMRRKKECELDIMSSKIINIDEDLFKNGESLFLSSVLIINENGEKKDRILILFSNYLVILIQNLNTHEFEFETKIQLVNSTSSNSCGSTNSVNNVTQNNATTTNNTSSSSSNGSGNGSNSNQTNLITNLVQIKRVNNFEQINNIYGGNLIDSVSISKYCFELIGVQTTSSSSSSVNYTNRLLIVCSTNYDLKMWLELISNQISKIQFSMNNKSLTNLKQNNQTTTMTPTTINQNLNQTINSPSTSVKSSSPAPTPSQTLNNSINQLTPNNQQTTSKLNTTSLNKAVCSPSNQLNTSQISTNGLYNQTHQSRKIFSMRAHPPLIPHFQLPNDVNPVNLPNHHNSASLESGSTLKRFMYKKAKLSEPFGKYHGADDDLKLLNVIESFCKTKVRQSVNVNVQEAVTTVVSKSSILPQPQRIAESGNESLTTNNIINSPSNDKNSKHIEEKNRLETNIQSLINELNEARKSNKELRVMVSNLQKQLETEKLSRRKLENYIKKQLKTSNLNTSNTNDLPSLLMMNVEHESSI